MFISYLHRFNINNVSYHYKTSFHASLSTRYLGTLIVKDSDMFVKIENRFD